jgi:selenocysteine lyase/cysteine desulfurase
MATARSTSTSAATSQVSTATPPLIATVGDDLQVPLVTGETVRYVDLDNAASTRSSRAVAGAVEDLLPWYSSVHRGAGITSRWCTERLDEARETVGRFVGARATDHVVFTRNTTDALNLLANALPDATPVITFESEHHANLLPWRRLGNTRHLPPPASPEAACRQAEEALAAEPKGTAVLAVTGASNVTGELWPIAELARIARRAGARIVLDAAQLAPHRAIDIAALDVDYVAFSGHKMYAPFGAGALVGRGDLLDDGVPYLAGGGAVTRVTSADEEWAVGPARHEGGTPNLVGIVALAAACAQLQEVGFDAIARHDAHLLAQVRRELDDVEGVTTFTLWDRSHPNVGVVTFNVDPHPAALVAAALSEEHGIGVRDGAFCAHPLVAGLVGDGVGAIRASIGCATSSRDIDRLVAAVRAIAARGTTVVGRGGCTAAGVVRR